MINLGYEIFKRYLMINGNTEVQAERYLENNTSYKQMIMVANQVIKEKGKERIAMASPTIEQAVEVLKKELPETMQALVNLLEKKINERD